MLTETKFTPTEQRLLAMLSDGCRHSKTELFECIEDELSSPMNVNTHLSLLRKKLAPKGEGVIVEFWQRRLYYRHVRFLPSGGQ